MWYAVVMHICAEMLDTSVLWVFEVYLHVLTCLTLRDMVKGCIDVSNMSYTIIGDWYDMETTWYKRVLAVELNIFLINCDFSLWKWLSIVNCFLLLFYEVRYCTSGCFTCGLFHKNNQCMSRRSSRAPLHVMLYQNCITYSIFTSLSLHAPVNSRSSSQFSESEPFSVLALSSYTFASLFVPKLTSPTRPNPKLLWSSIS